MKPTFEQMKGIWESSAMFEIQGSVIHGWYTNEHIDKCHALFNLRGWTTEEYCDALCTQRG